MKVYGGSICGQKKQGPFVSTGQAKGHYTLYVCDKQPHSSGEHADSEARESWR